MWCVQQPVCVPLSPAPRREARRCRNAEHHISMREMQDGLQGPGRHLLLFRQLGREALAFRADGGNVTLQLLPLCLQLLSCRLTDL